MDEDQYAFPHAAISKMDGKAALDIALRFGASVRERTPSLIVDENGNTIGQAIERRGLHDKVAAAEMWYRARMYAVAPEMMAVLKQALDDWPDWEDGEPVNGGDMVEWFGTWRETVKAAIAKVEGRE